MGMMEEEYIAKFKMLASRMGFRKATLEDAYV